MKQYSESCPGGSYTALKKKSALLFLMTISTSIALAQADVHIYNFPFDIKQYAIEQYVPGTPAPK